MTTVYNQRKELSEACMGASFSAKEVIEDLRKVLNQNFTANPGTINKIIKIVTSNLIQTAWDEKFQRINARIQRLVKLIIETVQNKQVEDPNIEAKKIRNEIDDIIAFIQMRGNLDPEGAKAENILPDFNHAFHLCVEVFKKIQWKPNTNPIFTNLKKCFDEQIMKTFAQLLNYNCANVDTESITSCMSIIIENVDTTGTFANLLTPPLKRFYRRLQIETFSHNLTNKNLRAAIELMLFSDADFKEQIRKLPNDFHKFAALDRKANEDDFFKKEAIKCAETTNSIDVLVYASKKYPSPKLYRRVMEKLGEVASHFVANFLIENIKSARELCKQFSSLVALLTPADKDRVYESIASSENGPALKCQAEATRLVNMKDDNDPMVREIRSIIAYVP